MTTVIFLDDERSPSQVKWVDYGINPEFKCFTSYPSFVDSVIWHIENNKEILVSFDHDIQQEDWDGNEVTGYHCLQIIVRECFNRKLPLPDCVFHTKNPIGKENMEVYYQNALKFEGEQNV